MQDKIIVEISKLGPTPPVYSVSPDENPDNPIFWIRRAGTRLLKDDPIFGYSEPFGVDTGIIPYPNLEFKTIFPTLKFHEIINYLYDIEKLKKWIMSYALKEMEIDKGLYYISKIIQENCEYNKNRTNLVKLYITKIGNIKNVYWSRYLKESRQRINLYIKKLTFVDLFLIPSNVYDRYVGRKLLSYYTDDELNILTKGVIENIGDRLKYIDAIVGLVLSQYQFFEINGNIFTLFYVKNLVKYKIKDYTEDEIINDNKINKMTILRLYIQLKASFDNEFKKLINWVEQNLVDLSEFYKNQRERQFKHEKILTPEDFESPEEQYNYCLICKYKREDGDFILCGHGVCMYCMQNLGRVKCPFCTEHFVCWNLNSNYIDSLPIEWKNEKNDVITLISNLKKKRIYQFDWENNDIKLFISG